jgi:hypothetical protein
MARVATLLDDKELERITGYKRGAEQARWFRQHGYYVECNARGIPQITHEQLDERRRLTPANDEKPESQPPKTEPNIVQFRQKLNLQQR